MWMQNQRKHIADRDYNVVGKCNDASWLTCKSEDMTD